MNLITIGTIGLDTITTPFEHGENVLGGSGTYACLAASYFEQSGLVAVAGEDFAEEYKKVYSQNNVDTTGLQILPGKTFRWGGTYDFNLSNRTTNFTELNVLELFNPTLPESYQAAEYVFLGNIHPGLQIKVLEQLRNPKFIALDTMNYWIEGAPADLKKVLSKIDALIINEGEARQLSAEHNLVKAAAKIFSMMQSDAAKQKTLIIKQGEYGLLMFQGDKIFTLPGFLLEDVVDPTGAGDSFAGGFMGYVAASGNASWENLKRACVAGSSLASFCVEKMGVTGLVGLTKEQIQSRVNTFKEITEF